MVHSVHAFDLSEELHLHSKSLANLKFYQINKIINYPNYFTTVTYMEL